MTHMVSLLTMTILFSVTAYQALIAGNSRDGSPTRWVGEPFKNEGENCL